MNLSKTTMGLTAAALVTVVAPEGAASAPGEITLFANQFHLHK